MPTETDTITPLILKAAQKARRESGEIPEPARPGRVDWPVDCTVGPGLEGAIACETRVGYVNGSQGRLIYQGYDIFDLCAHATYEEVCYLLLHGQLPTAKQLEAFLRKLAHYRLLPNTLRRLMGFPVEDMHPMAALRLGTNLMRHRLSWRDLATARPTTDDAIAADEDSIPMETLPRGEPHAIYEFRYRRKAPPPGARRVTDDAASMEACLHLISGTATIAAAIARIRAEELPITPDPELSHAANFLYMMTGQRPSPEEERVMNVCLILHADHGINASTFASLVVASTLSDIYLSVGSGIAALSGPLHGGANEEVLKQLDEIGAPERVARWYARARKSKRKIMGMGHRVYRTYDPRARVLAPLARHVAKGNPDVLPLLRTAEALEKTVVADLGRSKGVFPNVDFYSGLVYRTMGIPNEMFASVFAVSRVAGWTARINEYLRNNRIFRPRAVYVGDFDRSYVPLSQRRDRATRQPRKTRGAS